MKVRIIKSEGNNSWYRDRVGEIFNVNHLCHLGYAVVGGLNYVLAEHCEVVKEGSCRHTFKGKNCGYEGYIQYCDKTFENCKALENTGNCRVWCSKIFNELSLNCVDITDRYFGKVTLVGPNRFCGECKHLSITEYEQDRLRRLQFKFGIPHYCKKYGEKVIHENHHPNILKCGACCEVH